MTKHANPYAQAWAESLYRIELDPTDDAAAIYLNDVYVSDPVAVARLAQWILYYERYDLTVIEAINDLLAGKTLPDD